MAAQHPPSKSCLAVLAIRKQGAWHAAGLVCLQALPPDTTQLPLPESFVTTVVLVKLAPSGNSKVRDVVAAFRAGTSSREVEC